MPSMQRRKDSQNQRNRPAHAGGSASKNRASNAHKNASGKSITTSNSIPKKTDASNSNKKPASNNRSNGRADTRSRRTRGGRGSGNTNTHRDQRSSNKHDGRRGGSSKHSRFRGGKRNKNNNAGGSKRKQQKALPPVAEKTVRVIPLGGVEEVGRNMTAIEYGNDIVVVDAGIKFTSKDTPGVDFILPNIKYLEKNKDRVRAIVITHGHLDHIGGIPYIAPRIGNPPIYTREFGAMLIKKRQEEFRDQPKLNITTVSKSDGAIRISENLRVRFFGLSHSIPDSTGILIETPLGDIINTGDVRVDNEDGVPSQKEVEQYNVFKDRNILLLNMDSTGIEQPGWSISEREVIGNIDKILARAQGRLFIATFASQVERIIEFVKMAKNYNRKIVVEGRSMKNNMAIIKQLELVDMDHVIPIDEIDNYPPNQVMILATGAQGEEFAALMRIANQTHKNIKLTKYDTVVLSSSIIPGNENAISKLKDNLYRNDAKIITYLDSQVHASGHGKRAELEWIHSQIPYKFFMPVHGHHYMLKMHAELARQIGCPPENIQVADNSSVIEIQENGTKLVKRKETAPSGDMVVEGFRIGDMQEVLIRDRKALAEEGMFVIIATINIKTGKLRKSPDIISRGFIYLRENQEFLSETRTLIKKSVEKSAKNMNPIDFDLIKKSVDDDVSRFLFQKTAKSPIVIPVILGV